MPLFHQLLRSSIIKRGTIFKVQSSPDFEVAAMTSSPKLLKLMEAAKSLPEMEQRKVAAMLGACVADAAARPLHWVYDMGALKKYLTSGLGGVDRMEEPEFFPENRSPFYSLPTGDNSCYFDISGTVLKSLASGYDYKTLCRDLDEGFFGPGTEYSLEKRQNFMTLRAMGMAPAEPIEGKWLSGSLIKFKENLKAGKRPFGDPHIKETDGFCAALPLVLKHSGQSDLMMKAEDIIKTLSSWPTAVSYGLVACNIMDKFIQGKEDPIGEAKKEAIDTYPAVAQGIQSVEKHKNTDHVYAVGMAFGRPCYNPGSPQGAMHAFLTSGDFKEAVRKTIRAGGCCCSRSFFIGAMAGAKYGLDGIPQDWIAKTIHGEEILELSINVFRNN